MEQTPKLPLRVSTQTMESQTSPNQSPKRRSLQLAIQDFVQVVSPSKSRSPSPKSPKRRKWNVVDLQPKHMARQMCLVDAELFKHIDADLFVKGSLDRSETSQITLLGSNGSLSKPLPPLPVNDVPLTQQFNRVVRWCQAELLFADPDDKKRAVKLAWMIQLAQKLLDYRNFHSLKAVVSALQSAPIHRLETTWNGLSKKEKSIWQKLELVMSPDDNHKQYRLEVDQVQPDGLATIPYLGVLRLDLTYLHETKKSELGDAQARFERVTQLIKTWQETCSYKDFTEEPSIASILYNPWFLETAEKMWEEECWKQSCTIEAKKQIPSDSISTLNLSTSNQSEKSLPDLPSETVIIKMGQADWRQENGDWKRVQCVLTKSNLIISSLDPLPVPIAPVVSAMPLELLEKDSETSMESPTTAVQTSDNVIISHTLSASFKVEPVDDEVLRLRDGDGRWLLKTHELQGWVDGFGVALPLFR
jgi:hypothetical protein